MMDLTFRKYFAIVVIVAGVLLGVREAREQVIKIGCLPAGGTKPAASWMDACLSDRIGDYSHSAIWFGTEPATTAAIYAAKVLFFGNSRMEFAASRGGAAEWFAAKRIRFYILAFGYDEESGWAKRLLERLRPHPSVIVFDTNQYFTGGQSLPAQAIEKDPEGELKTALATRSFMASAPEYCRYLSILCGRTAAGYRADADGHAFAVGTDRVWFGKTSFGNYVMPPPPPPSYRVTTTICATRRPCSTASMPIQGAWSSHWCPTASRTICWPDSSLNISAPDLSRLTSTGCGPWIIAISRLRVPGYGCRPSWNSCNRSFRTAFRRTNGLRR